MTRSSLRGSGRTILIIIIIHVDCREMMIAILHALKRNKHVSLPSFVLVYMVER